MSTELYRVSTVMSKLDCSKATVYRMVARGDLEMVKIGINASRITGASLDRIVASGAQENR